ncbi:MAG: PKD domain-containing protein [Crocinitomicaceae bacterium]|nr:PKD domain-containing protein [Crocinitomicaceae bacterium]
MKRLALLLIGALTSFSLFSQKIDAIQAEVLPIEFHGITGNLIDYVEPSGTVNEITRTENSGPSTKNWGTNPNINPNALPNGMDPAWQTDYAPAAINKVLTQSWDGMGYTSVNPPDPTVDVGPNHVVQMINGGSGSYIQVYSKTGVAIGPQVYFDNFMSMPGGSGDPIVLYDERADRWLLSEFSSTGNNMHVAISTTPDPTGTYYTYTFNSPGGFPDYPKYSIWNNEYVITANVGFPDIYALDRTSLLAGTPATAQMFNMPNFGTIGFQTGTPVSLNGTTLPPAGAPAMVMRIRDDAWTGAATDALEIWELDIDWATPANSTFAQTSTLNTAPYESELCGYTSFACIDQPGNANYLDPLRELLMNRIHYRNFGTHESIVCSHVTDVSGNDDTGIRWYELRRTGGTGGSWAIYQQGTYAPDGDSRWMPTIGISATGNIGLAYNVASSSLFPSIRYTGRKECDPLNVMTEPETEIATGTANNGSGRYGDYNAMGLDPSDGETFYMTGEYNPNGSGAWSTRIGAFSIASCSPQVSFGAATYSVDESSASQPNACLPYAILNVPISIGADPSQAAGITVNVTGGTATNNVDYAIQNNTFTFDDPTLTGNVVIWIYNDDYVEGNETITLDYTLNANGGDAVAGSINQTVTITINDDDLDPASSPGATVTIFQDDFEDGTMIPFTTVNAAGAPNDPWQVGNNAAASSGAFAIPASNTGQFAWLNDDACNCVQDDVDLTFPSVDLTNLTTAAISFYTYFENNTYLGDNENADLQVSVGGGAFTTIGPLVASVIDGAWITQNFDLTAYVGNANVVLRVKYSDATGWLYGCTVDDVLITGQGPIAVQTATNAATSQTANLSGNETVHFYDQATGNVMITLENTSSFDYGCVTVEVDRAGTAALQFNNTTPADFLASKSYTVVPTNTNPSGTFNITTYYEEAEVAGWEAATGNSRNNAEIVKVAGANAIQDVNPGNAGTFTIANAATTIGAFNSDVTFTSSFGTGFSGFGLGIYNAISGTPPVADFSGTPTTICAGESVSFTDLSTNTPTSWSWDFGDLGTSSAQNPSHTYNTAGTYTVILTATNADGSDGHTITDYITVNGLPTVIGTGTSTICDGQSASISASGATSYSWDNGLGAGASQTVSPTSTTTYIVTGTTVGCSNTAAVVITVNPVPTVTASGTATICDGQSASISASGATTYSWDQGIGAGASPSVSPTSTTTYTVTGTTAGCSNTDQVTITVTPLPNVVASGTTPICNGASASISASGATSYSWDNGLGAGAAQTVSPASTTTYTVTGTTSGCANTDAITVVVNTNPTISVSSANDPTTCATATGSIVVSGSGIGNVTWTGTASGSATSVSMPYTITGLTSGSYNITYIDGNGCTSNTISQSLTDPSAPSVVANGATTICSGQSTVISGSGATTYAWDNGLPTGASHTVSPTVTTTYNVTGTTAGCSNTAAVTITVTPAATISAGTVTNPTTCATATGSIQITGSGTGDVSWTGTGSGSATSVSLPYTVTGLTSGSYNITFIDGTGCTSNTVVQALSDPSAPTVTANGTATICEGQSTLISSAGATTYAWDNGLGTGASHIVSPTSTTTYNVTGTTAGCSDAASVTITVTPLPTVTATGTASICNGASTVITGSGAASYSWDNALGAGASQTVSPSTNTTYTVTGTTAGCSNTDQVTVTVNANPTVSATGTATICAGASTPIAASGATSFVWDNGLGTNASYTVSPATTTTYNVTGTDGSGCSDAASVTITVIAAPVISVLSSTDPTTCGSTTGSIIIGGSGTGDITWTGASSGSATGINLPYTITGLTAGSYATTFTNGTGCTSNTLVEVLSDPSGPSVTATATGTNICQGQSTSITGAGANSYSWDNGLGAGATHNVSPSVTTTYMVTGTDASNCSSIAQVTIVVNPAPTVVATGTSAICEGSSTSIDASGAVTFNWDNGIGAGATQTVSPTTTTTYIVTGTDANGCSNTDQVIVTVNALPAVVANGATWICDGESTTIDASGASTYSWDNGLGAGAAQTVSPTSTTTYTVIGTDATGCTNSDQVTITVNALPTVVASSDVDICEGNSATIDASGASNYDWDNGLGAGISHNVSPTVTTTYVVTGTDANSCSNTDQVTITVNSIPTVSITPASIDTICSNVDPITLVGAPVGGTFTGPGVSGTVFTPSVAGPGTHTITYDYTDGNGCSNSIGLSVIVEDCAGIDEYTLTGVSLFPNPNDGKFMIEGLEAGTEFQIYDERGRLVMDAIVESDQQMIEMPVVNNGIYYLRATVDGKEGGIKFLIAQ